MIINKELGLNFSENPWQGSFIVDELTDLVEEAVYKEFEAHLRARRRAGRDGHHVPARQDPGRVACTTSTRSTTAALPLIGVNTFLPKEHAGEIATDDRADPVSAEEEKAQQIGNVQTLPGRCGTELGCRWSEARCRQTAREREEYLCRLDGSGEDAFAGAD